MGKKRSSLVRAAFSAVVLAMTMLLLSGCGNYMVLDPKGPIAQKQLDLIGITVLLCSIIIVPVLIITFIIVWRYRASNKKADYKPEWAHNNLLETIWWGIPIVIIAILAVITIRYTHELEPSKTLAAESEKEVVIQVASLDWKWLFMYPEEGIATINTITIPEDRSVRFELTSDAPMNSFWIPELGGQIYTMSGMSMALHLKADEPGDYFGTAANFSGEYFANMTFDVHATTEADYEKWVADAKNSSDTLTDEGYQELAKPSADNEQLVYASFPEGLYERIVTKYMHDGAELHEHGSASSDEEGKQSADAGAASTEAEGHDSSSHTGH
ncbi:ubiquinol oxidase subunit II [Saccharibacillus sp. CPCC 101409]|uniref:ubiquinol oxidase subunit II n=1 Tax=Saccharibacillus sp. CPCC 101409 TaxID=3058041 RepID=UPI0026716135|nr:ubiquinol oxidase subunit II [Saccharibacillus sp. CPCC 101409]MDO3412750.1 ubiquinol oxidase subunit II [Saccharibacillus sp. CPCC 101409]